LATRGSLLSKATHKGTIPPTQVSAAGPQLSRLSCGKVAKARNIHLSAGGI